MTSTSPRSGVIVIQPFDKIVQNQSTNTSQNPSFAQTFRNSILNHYETSNQIINRLGENNNPQKTTNFTNNNNNQLIDILEKQEIGLGFYETLFTFIKVNIVSGFLFLPYGFHVGGWLFSIIAIIAVSLIIIYCNVSLSDCTEVTNSYSFSVVGEQAMGKIGKYLVEYGIAISQICFPCGYANLIASVMDEIFHKWFDIPKETHFYFYFGIAMIIIFVPLCYIRDISSFSRMHLIGDIAVLSTVIVLAIFSIFKINSVPNFSVSHLPLIKSTWAKVIGMSVTMLEGAGVILPIKESMQNKKDFNKVIIIGMSIISLILIGFPIIAYFAYQNDTGEIILQNLPIEKVFIQIVLLLLIFSIIVVYPVVLNPAFRILEFHFIKCQQNAILWQNILRTSLVFVTVVVGVLSIGKFDNLLSLVGCAVCTPIALIFPSLFHYKLYKDKQGWLRTFLDLFITIIGVLTSLIILIFTLINWNARKE